MPTYVTPRRAQWREVDEAVEQSRAAREGGDLRAAHYWSGVAAGYFSAFTTGDPLWERDLARADQSLVAAPFTVDRADKRVESFRRSGWPELGCTQAMFDMGVLFGFREATAEEDDAEECIACGKRILTSRPRWEDSFQTWHGWVCDDLCHESFDGGHCCRAERGEGLA
jgi:hypothetical protein